MCLYIYNGQWCNLSHKPCICSSKCHLNSKRFGPKRFVYILTLKSISLLKEPPERNKQRISYVLLIEWLNDSESIAHSMSNLLHCMRALNRFWGCFFIATHWLFFFCFLWKQLTFFYLWKFRFFSSSLSNTDSIFLPRFVCLFHTFYLYIDFTSLSSSLWHISDAFCSATTCMLFVWYFKRQWKCELHKGKKKNRQTHTHINKQTNKHTVTRKI